MQDVSYICTFQFKKSVKPKSLLCPGHFLNIMIFVIFAFLSLKYVFYSNDIPFIIIYINNFNIVVIFKDFLDGFYVISLIHLLQV